MEIKRGYVKWTDDDGVFHKEPLHEHPDLLASASAAEQIAAEEARRLNDAAEAYQEEAKADAEEDQWDTLEALEAAPEYVLTTAQLTTNSEGEIVAAPEEPISSVELIENPRVEEIPEPAPEEVPLVREEPLPQELWSPDHEEALDQLERETT